MEGLGNEWDWVKSEINKDSIKNYGKKKVCYNKSLNSTLRDRGSLELAS